MPKTGMGFFDWVRTKGWHRVGHHRPPGLGSNPTDRVIRRTLRQLLDTDAAHDAKAALSLVPADRLLPLAGAMVHDARFRSSVEWPNHCAATALEMLLELLDKAGSATPLGEALRLSEATAWQHRRIAARYLPRTGRAEFAGPVIRLLEADRTKENESLVSDRTIESLTEAARAGRVEAVLATAVYDVLRPWALRKDRGTGGKDVATLMLLLDPPRATADLASLAGLDPDLNWIEGNLSALRDAGVDVPAPVVRRLLDDALERYAKEQATGADMQWSRWTSLAEECLTRLQTARDSGLPARLDALLDHHSRRLRGHAASALAGLAGIDPQTSVFDTLDRGGTTALNGPQRAYWLAFVLDTEVNNGGFLQYLSNSSGDDVIAASAALRDIGAADAADNVDAVIATFGPRGVPADRDARNTVLAAMLDGDESPFGDHDTRWYADADGVYAVLQHYAVRHAEAFGAGGTRPPG